MCFLTGVVDLFDNRHPSIDRKIPIYLAVEKKQPKTLYQILLPVTKIVRFFFFLRGVFRNNFVCRYCRHGVCGRRGKATIIINTHRTRLRFRSFDIFLRGYPSRTARRGGSRLPVPADQNGRCDTMYRVYRKRGAPFVCKPYNL